MTYDSRVRPHQLRPSDSDGNIVTDGTYILTVAEGKVIGLVEYVVPIILLPAGSGDSDVPAGTAVGIIIAIKA